MIPDEERTYLVWTWVAWVEKALPVTATVGAQKSPSGARPEGQVDGSDQTPRGAPVTAEITTTDTTTAERRWAEAFSVEPEEIIGSA